MKSITKKVVALSAVFAMTASFAVSAATVDSVTVTPGTAVDDAIKVEYTMSDAATDAQATILVYTGESAFDANGGSDNVAYINQDAASAGKFEFKMRDSLKPGDNEQKEYTVMVGGTDVATAKTVTFKLGTANKTTYSISGTVGEVMNFGDGEYAADTEAYAASIDVCDENYDVIETIAIDVSSIDPNDGIGSVPFTVSNLEIGKKYYLYFMRAGACDKEIALNSTITNDIIGYNVELWAGDPNDDGVIDGTDVAIALAKAKSQDYDIECDADADTYVDGTDISIILNNAKRFASYNEVIN